MTVGDTLRPAIPLKTAEKETVLISWLNDAGAAQYAEILRDDLSGQVTKLGSVSGLKVWKPTKFKTRQVVELVE